MNKVTIRQIRDFSPCYDPAKYLPENWEGTALDILNVTDCPQEDRLWVVLRNEFLTDRELRLFAVWCARQALAIPGNESEICSNTCNVAERYANGEATDEELDAACSAARYAARDAARDAARYAARYAACSAASSTACSAASSAAWSAACSAARYAAWSAASSTAWSAASSAQIEHLKTILNKQP